MIRTRYYLELALALGTGVLALLTQAWPNWIEACGLEPDGGSGSSEVGLVRVATGVCVLALVAARRERHCAVA